MSARQLGLPFSHQASYQEADFVPAPSNAEALAWLAEPWPDRRLALWGGEGSGKTHLLHAWAGRAGAAVLYGPELRYWRAEARARIAPWAIAVDDADLAAAGGADGAALLHLVNTAAELARPVLLAGRTPPSRWEVGLADLASRLRATVAVELRPADDTLLRVLLARLLSERQIAVPQPVQDWLLVRLPRTAASVRAAAARLDRAALARGGTVTRALAAEVVAALANDDGSRSEPAAASPSVSPSGPLLL